MALTFDDLPDAPSGALSFDDLPGAVPPAAPPPKPRQVGFTEAAGRNLMSGYASGGRGLGDIFMGLPATAADIVATGATEALRPLGVDTGYDHQLMEGYTRNWTKPMQRYAQYWQPEQGAELTTAGEAGALVGSLASMLNTALLATPAAGAAAAPTAASLPPRMALPAARVFTPPGFGVPKPPAQGVVLRAPPAPVGTPPATAVEAASQEFAKIAAPGVIAMTPMAVTGGADTYEAARAAGATQPEAMLPAAVQATTTQAMGTLPIAAGGSLPSRLARGGALGYASTEAQHGAVQELLPEKARQPLTDAQLYGGAGAMAILSGMFGRKGAPVVTREQINQEAYAPYAREIERIYEAGAPAREAKAAREAELKAAKAARVQALEEGAPPPVEGKEARAAKAKELAEVFREPVPAQDYSGTTPNTLDDLANTRIAQRMLGEIPGEAAPGVDPVRVLADEIARAEARRATARTQAEKDQIDEDLWQTARGLKQGRDAFGVAGERQRRKASDVFDAGEDPFASYQSGDAATSAERGRAGDVSVPGREGLRPESFTFVGEVRDGKLVGDEVKLTGNTRETKTGNEVEVTYIDRDGTPSAWVPESKIIGLSRPKSPRYAQDVAARSVAPPAGVGKDIGLSGPRASADRIDPNRAWPSYSAADPADPSTPAARRLIDDAREEARAQRDEQRNVELERDFPKQKTEVERLEDELAAAKAEAERFDAEHLPPKPERQSGRYGGTTTEVTDKNGRVRKVKTGYKYDRDMDGDTLLDAIGRRGGLRWDELLDDGMDAAGMAARNRKSLGYAPFRKDSMRTLDELARVLADEEIVPPGTGPRELRALIDDELGGGDGTQWRDLDQSIEYQDAQRESNVLWGKVQDAEAALENARNPEPAEPPPAADATPEVPWSPVRRAEPGRESPARQPALELEQQTPESLRAKAEAETAAREKAAAEQRAVEQKAAADKDLPNFRLQGSDRPSDADATQGDMLGAKAEPKPTVEQRPAGVASAPKTEAQRGADVDARVDELPAERVRDVARMLGAKTEGVPTETLREQIKASELADVERALTPHYPTGQAGFINLTPLADAVQKAFKWATGDLTSPQARREARVFAEQIMDALGGIRSGERASGRSLGSDVFNRVFASAEANLRALGAAHNSKTLAGLADIFHATAGKAAGVTRTYDESVQAERSKRMVVISKKVTDVLDKHGLTADKAAYERIVRMVEDPLRPRLGVEGQIAKDIEAYLKEIHGYMKAAGVDIGEVKGYFPRQIDTGRVIRSYGKFLASATKAYQAQGSTAAEAAKQAEALARSIVFGDAGRIGKASHAGAGAPNFTKSRVFNKQAAAILDADGWYVKDLDAVLYDYTHRAVTRAEVARRFGDGFKNWKSIHDQILSEDPNAAGAMSEVESMIETLTGTRHPDEVGWGIQALNAVKTWTTLALLEKATFSSLGEALIAPGRAAKGDRADTKQYLDNLVLHLDNAQRAIRRLPPSQRMQAAKNYAEDTGLISGHGLANLQAARTGVDPVGQLQSAALAKFFMRNGLSQWTNYARTTTAINGMIFLRRLSKDLAAGGKKNEFFLRELGVPKGEEAAFAKWLNGQLKGSEVMPPNLAGKYGDMYNTAMLRFADQVVMRPTAATRPAWASTPLGSTIFQLQSFNYAFQKNFVNRAARVGAGTAGKRGAAEGFSLQDQAYIGSMLALTGASLVGANLLIGEVRDQIYGQTRPLSASAKVERAAARSGLMGVADPYVQSIAGTRYDRDVSQTFLGASVSNLSSVVNTAGAMAGAGTEVTAAQKRQAAKRGYDFIVEPAAQFALTKLPVSPMTILATVYGIPAMRDPFVEAVAGKKDYATRYREAQEPLEGLIERMTAADKRTPAEVYRDAEKEREKQERVKANERREAAGLPPIGAEDD